MTARSDLQETLSRREPTTGVASLILELGVDLPSQAKTELTNLAKGYRPFWMNDDFDVVVGAEHQLTTFDVLFPPFSFHVPAGVDPYNPGDLLDLRNKALELIAPGASSALGALAKGRHSNPTRKRLRFLKRFEKKIDRVAASIDLRQAQMQAKSRLAYRVQTDDKLTLAFCAYLAARANRRSIFLIGSQSKAQDIISDGVFKALEESDTTDWFAVAMVKPTRDVIERCTPEQRGELVGLFHGEMQRWADRLAMLWPSLPERMRDEMVMVKGVDSSRWNAFAGALNTMRSAWISATLACELDEVLDSYLPGKAPRLMASDLVWWYRNEGKELHEDTRMFAALPRPWEITSGQVEQGRNDILTAARKLGIDAQATGWVGPRHPQPLERPAPEPILVHGIVVSDPVLASSLRRCGAFSGKRLKHIEEMPEIERTVVSDGDRVVPVTSAA